MNRRITVSVVMPCLNEAETLGVCVKKAHAAIRATGLAGEVVVADNGSTDGSQAIAAREGARIVDVPIRGYGAALMSGIESAKGEYILMADADDSYDFAHLPRFVDALNQGADLVMGNRFKGGIRPGAMPFLHRYLGNPVLSFLGRLFFRAPVNDFHCGLRAFKKCAIERLNLQTTGMEYASEMVVKASLLGLNIAEVPTTLSPDGRSRPPHLRTWRDGWRHLRFLLLYSPRWLFLYPGMFLVVTGSVITAWLLPGPRTIGNVTLDVDTLVYAIGALLVGFHFCVFALGAKIFGTQAGLLPRDPEFEKWFRYFNLETGVSVGIVLLVAGLSTALYAVSIWHRSGFGQLLPTQALRITLPSVTALMLGVEAIFASFFLSLLGLTRKGKDVA